MYMSNIQYISKLLEENLDKYYSSGTFSLKQRMYGQKQSIKVIMYLSHREESQVYFFNIEKLIISFVFFLCRNVFIKKISEEGIKKY